MIFDPPEFPDIDPEAFNPKKGVWLSGKEAAAVFGLMKSGIKSGMALDQAKEQMAAAYRDIFSMTPEEAEQHAQAQIDLVVSITKKLAQFLGPEAVQEMQRLAAENGMDWKE